MSAAELQDMVTLIDARACTKRQRRRGRRGGRSGKMVCGAEVQVDPVGVRRYGFYQLYKLRPVIDVQKQRVKANPWDAPHVALCRRPPPAVEDQLCPVLYSRNYRTFAQAMKGEKDLREVIEGGRTDALDNMMDGSTAGTTFSPPASSPSSASASSSSVSAAGTSTGGSVPAASATRTKAMSESASSCGTLAGSTSSCSYVTYDPAPNCKTWRQAVKAESDCRKGGTSASGAPRQPGPHSEVPPNNTPAPTFAEVSVALWTQYLANMRSRALPLGPGLPRPRARQ
eukprot:gene6441-biopygen8921